MGVRHRRTPRRPHHGLDFRHENITNNDLIDRGVDTDNK